jgi:hypothetical protein
VALQSCSSTMALATPGPRWRCICCTPPHAAGRVAERRLRQRCAEHALIMPSASPEEPAIVIAHLWPFRSRATVGLELVKRSSRRIALLSAGRCGANLLATLGARTCGAVVEGSYVWPEACLPLLVAPRAFAGYRRWCLKRLMTDLPAQSCPPSRGLSAGSGLRAMLPIEPAAGNGADREPSGQVVGRHVGNRPRSKGRRKIPRFRSL